jgi:predicted molibdopterin-dependent oxidoreductase YjgC
VLAFALSSVERSPTGFGIASATLRTTRNEHRTMREGEGETERGGESATICPFCAVGCTLASGEASEESDPRRTRARGVVGPANPNGRLCRKGIEAFDALGRDDRLTRPLVRTDGELVPTSWDDALAQAATSLAGVRRAHGADGLAFLGAPHCTNEENYLLSKLARLLGTNNVDNRARICHASAMGALETRLGYPAMTNSLSDLPEADLLLVVGANPADQQPIAFDSYVRPAVAGGTTLVHVEPVANRTTRLADHHLPARPGTDRAVLTAIAALVKRAGGVDEAFIDARTTGYEAYADALEAVDVEGVVDRAGLDRTTLERVAGQIARADRVAVIAATGIEEPKHEGTATADALIDLLALTGNLGRPGTGMNVFRGLNNEQGASDMGCRPDALPGHESVSDPTARERVAEEWGVDVPISPGLDEQEALAAFGETVFGALVVGENPAVEKRNAEWVGSRLDALETLVVCDVFESETTARADVVLPAASGLEKTGTVTNLDRRVQALRPTIDPPGEARSDLAILSGLGERLVGEAFDYADHESVFEELTRVSPIHSGMTTARVADGGMQWPVHDTGVDGTGILHTDAFRTPDGRVAFGPVATGVPRTELDGLTLVVGSRAGGFAAEGEADRRLALSPADADRLGLSTGERVRVSSGTAAIDTRLAVTASVTDGIASLHADIADPLVRAGATTVSVDPTATSNGGGGADC